MKIRRIVGVSYRGQLTGIVIGSALLMIGVVAVPILRAQGPAPPSIVHMTSPSDPPPNPQISILPLSVSLSPGAVQQFTATITGTINQQVTWSATGGTIASSGMYTAGPTAGQFTVTATIGGGTLSASAAVTNPGATPTGTAIYPGDSIQAMVSAAPIGAAFILKAGVHRMQSITPKDGQTFTGEAGAILSGARLLTTFTQVGARWVASGQTQQGAVSGSVANGVCRATSPRCGYPEDLYINDVPLQHVDDPAKGGPGKWYFDYAADQIYFWDDPTGKKVETSVTPRAFGGTATGVTLSSLVLEKYASPTQSEAVTLGSGWLLEKSEVRLNHFAGVGTGGTSTARGNHVHHNGAFGFTGAGGGILVENNEIDHNNYAGYDSYWGAGGSKWVYTDGLIVRGNFSHHNDGPGLWTDINNINTLYENNIVEDNRRGGIFHEISYAAIIRNNTLRRNGAAHDYPGWTTGAGIEVVDSPSVEVYGNTLVDNWQGITGQDDGRSDTTVQNHGAWRLTDFNVHNNSVSQATDLGPGSGRTGIITSVSGTFTTSNNRYHDNNYALGSYAKYFIWSGADRTEQEWKGFGQDVTGTFQR